MIPWARFVFAKAEMEIALAYLCIASGRFIVLSFHGAEYIK